MNSCLKKFILSISILFVLTMNSYSLGAGVQAGVSPSVDINESGLFMNNTIGNLTGTIKLFRIPAVFGFGLDAGVDNSQFIFGISGFFDYWFLDYQIKNTWNLYSGAGVSVKMLMDLDSNFILNAGPRFFAGMNWLFYDNYVEYYVQLNINPNFVMPISSDLQNGIFRLAFPVETGVRLHF